MLASIFVPWEATPFVKDRSLNEGKMAAQSENELMMMNKILDLLERRRDEMLTSSRGWWTSTAARFTRRESTHASQSLPRSCEDGIQGGSLGGEERRKSCFLISTEVPDSLLFQYMPE
jgi:hypothetical protein